MYFAKTVTATAVAAVLAATGALAADNTYRDESQAQAYSGEVDTRTDGWIDAKVSALFALDPHLNPFDIQVEVNDGRVHLSGQVESEGEKLLAEEIASRTDGVSGVENELEIVAEAPREPAVDPSTIPGRDSESFVEEQTAELDTGTDGWIDAKLTALYAIDPHLNPFGIAVDVEKGVVTLNGMVESEAERALAGEMARGIKGVQSVSNALEVSGQAPRRPGPSAERGDMSVTGANHAM